MALKESKEIPPEPKVEEPKEEVKETPEAKGKGEEPKAEVPDQYQGKSAEDLAQILQEKEKMIGDQSQQIGTLRKDLDYYEKTPQGQPQGQFQTPPPQAPITPTAPYDPYGGYQGYGQPQYPNPQQPYGQYGQPPQEPTQFNFENPMESVNKAVEQRLQQAEQRRRTEEAQRYAFESREGYEEGKGRAYKSQPKLYEGIEREVEGAIQNFYRQGFLRPSDMRREDTWETAAQVIRLKRGELGYLKPEAPLPMSAPHSETPASMKEETLTPVELNPIEEDTKRAYGLTDEEVRDIKTGKKGGK